MSKLGIGIFQGKKARYNTLILKTLYDNGPKTLWEISKQIRKIAKPGKVPKAIEYGSTQIIQSVVSKRLKDLEKKNYVAKRKDKKWVLHFKGFMAFLVNEPTPRIPNEAWTEVIPNLVYPKLRELPDPIKFESKGLKIEVPKKRAEGIWKELNESLHDIHKITAFSQTLKNLMSLGVVNLDLISNMALAKIILVDSEGDPLKMLERFFEGEKADE